MKQWKDDDIAALKQQAVRECGRADVEQLDFDPQDFACIVRIPTAAEFWEYLDASLAKSPDAAAIFAMRCTLSPARGEVGAAFRRFPFLAHRVTEALESVVGGDPARAAHTLDAKTPDGLLDDLGVPRDAAANLRSQYPHKGQLKIVEHEMGVVVLRAPSDGIIKLWRDTYGTKEKARACFDLAMACSAYPAEDDARALFERAPAIPYAVLLDPILDLGGLAGKAKRKKL